MIDVPYLKNDTITDYATSFLKEHWQDEIPVDIEWIIDNKLQIDIIPTPGLRRIIEVEGFITCDGKCIYVDDDVASRYGTRYRFTLAHEIGHKYIHGDELTHCCFHNIEEWKQFIDRLDPAVLNKMEYQANEFAGKVLVPKPHLSREFDELLGDVERNTKIAKSKGLKAKDYLPYAESQIATELSSRFDVSKAVMEHRIKAEGLMSRVRAN